MRFGICNVYVIKENKITVKTATRKTGERNWNILVKGRDVKNKQENW